MDNQVFTTWDDFRNYLTSVYISDGDVDQPTIAAINSAQSQYVFFCKGKKVRDSQPNS
ncbi:unnamed protein product [Cylicostephanus goldi]|uniref:Uncharacterized protein n=1 Tax=Cylicostephanus goldi TaxID=71465 RepID=A0A3P7NA64_CYLGO|nr:unnamed protein product [Cylicostephanus goldi]